MAKVTPAEFKEKWQRRMKASTEDMRRGVERVTEAPGKQAAAKKDKWIAKMTSKETQDKWADRVSKVTVEEWREKYINKGLGRISAGVDEAGDKVEAFADELLPFIETGQKAIEKMPDVTLDDSINRMGAFIRHMSKFKRK